MARPGGAGRTTDAADVRRGIGFAVGFKNLMYAEGYMDGSTARCRLEDGLATVTCAAAEVGQGFVTLVQQIARTVLGVRGRAGRAGRHVDRLGRVHLGQPPDDDVGRRGPEGLRRPCRDRPARRVTSPPVGRSTATVFEATVEHHHRGHADRSTATARATPTWRVACAAHRAVVDVDPELGLVRVVHVATAQDVGRVLNPVQCLGQVEGGIAQGVGLAVMEEILIEDGRVRNPSFTDYLIPTALDAPEVDATYIEVPEPDAPFGAKGVGEPPVISSTPAIVAAIRAATGRSLYADPGAPVRHSVRVMHAPRVSFARLRSRLDALAELGATEGGGSCRLALTDADKQGRDLVVTWMRDLGLRVDIDGIGNVVGTWPADRDEPPVLLGSHIDTVATGGIYDGCLGVLAGLEVVETLITEGVEPAHPVAVAFFTDEEGSRFAPDMLGSLVFAGGMAVEDARSVVGVDGAVLGDELDRIGYAGPAPCPARPPHAYLELHIEQGPVLEAEGITIGAVTGVQAISWTEIVVEGQSNHAGTTPMDLRHDAGYVAARIATQVRRHRRQGRAAAGRDGGPHRAPPQPGQRGGGPGHAHRRPPQHRRAGAVRGRARAGRPGRPAGCDRGRDDPPAPARPASRRWPSTRRSSRWSRRSRPRTGTRCGDCPPVPGTMRRCWPACARPGWSSCRA